MATVQEFVTAKLQRYQIEFSQVEIDALLTDAGTTASAVYSTSTASNAKRALVKAISELLAVPDITEGGMSIKYDRAGLKAYLTELKIDLGESVSTDGQPKLRMSGRLW